MDAELKIFPPGKYIKDALEKRGWTQSDLAYILGRNIKDTNDIVGGKRKFTPEIAQELAVAFQTSPEYWLDIENRYRLAQVDYVDIAIIKRSEIYNKYPAKDMIKRGWIQTSDTVENLEAKFTEFYSEANNFAFAARKSTSYLEHSPIQTAWIIRAKKMARILSVAEFDDKKMDELIKSLRNLAASSKSTHKVAQILANYGIRFVVVEQLPNARIDGAAFWLDDNSPVIAMSIRFDNIGSFWFTLFHEIIHIKHKDQFSLDDLDTTPVDEIEIRANREAAEVLIPQARLETFIRMTRPYYSESKINNLATQLKIHPGIIVGQLQHRKEISFNQHHKLMPKVRELAIKTALTDGWGQPVPYVVN